MRIIVLETVAQLLCKHNRSADHPGYPHSYAYTGTRAPSLSQRCAQKERSAPFSSSRGVDTEQLFPKKDSCELSAHQTPG